MKGRERAKAPKAIRTSDVARPRTLALSAIGAGLAATLATLAEGTPLESARPIARPHAKVACASCHASPAALRGPQGGGPFGMSDPPAAGSSVPAVAGGAGVGSVPPFSASESCKGCHGATAHGSTRAAHRSLAAKGELACATCHAQHAGAQGLTFEDASVVRWGSGAEEPLATSPRTSGVAPGAIARGTTVPLVALAACARCHDPTRASDPIASCVPASVRTGGADPLGRVPSQCFDEHAKLDGGRGTGLAGGGERAVCAAQHGPLRFAAWDAARELAATTRWVSPTPKEGRPWTPAAAAVAAALVLGAAHSAIERRRRTAESSPKRLPVTAAARKRLPTINPTTCLGCYACVDACPFDVLTIEKYVAVVARPEECCGVVLCEQVCPNGSLRVTEGEPITDRPETDDDLESRDVPGLFLAGDLTGLPLIKNAINQGTRAVDRIAATLPKRRSDGAGDAFDLVVIGGGPAGLSAALRAKEKGLSCVVLEQATVAASIRSFPRDKIVHDPPLDLPIEGELWLKEATKEELLAQWTRIVRARSLDVREHHRVVDLTKETEGAGFVIRAEVGGDRSYTARAARVVLAIGRRGTPRKLDLDIEPGAEDRVAYALADARSFEGKSVVVVGLGDSAIEAAVALSRQPGTSVTVSYRGSGFKRGKAKNVSELESLVRQQKVKVLFETVPTRVTNAGVSLSFTGPHGGARNVAADALLVLIGGLPSWDLLLRAGVRRRS
jgi:thioredoxin reductase